MSFSSTIQRLFCIAYLQKKVTDQKKKEQDEVNQLFKPVIAQKISAGLYALQEAVETFLRMFRAWGYYGVFECDFQQSYWCPKTIKH